MIFSSLHEILKKGEAIVLVTVISVEGSSPAKAGFKMLVNEKGHLQGSVGGGNIEHDAIEKAKDMLRRGRKTYRENYNLTEDLGMLCGGKAELFFEAFFPTRKIYIFGAGHVGEALANILKYGDFQIFCLDNRQEVVEKYKNNDKIKAKIFDYEKNEDYEKLEIDSHSFCVILTHKHSYDYDVMKNIYSLSGNPRYVGMIGSKLKVKANIDKFKNEMKDIELKNLFAPIGLKIGGDSAFEIALSIAAEIQSVIYGKEVNNMKLDPKS